MENFNQNNRTNKHMGIGILLVVMGSVFFLREAGLGIPHWVLSWHTVMLAAGLWLGFKKDFNGGGWFALTLIGAYFTLKDITLFDFELSKIAGGLVLVAVGLYLVLKPKQNRCFSSFNDKNSIDFHSNVK
ncbi:LiaF transmembrane domain-containing protein [Pedobacter sp. MW01-1-1]|uniref:LiaF transmembrane domain-containing protein n=1 Tax=Pedobacter sp. MW01-1-1 TaxID=3383027 RepID=UPI003FF03C60